MRYQLIAFTCDIDAYANALILMGHSCDKHPVSDRYHWMNSHTDLLNDVESKIQSEPNKIWLVADPALSLLLHESLNTAINRSRVVLNILPETGVRVYDHLGVSKAVYEQRNFRRRVYTRNPNIDDQIRFHVDKEEAQKVRARPLVPQAGYDDAFKAVLLAFSGIKEKE